MSDEERENIAKTIKDIEGYKEKFDNWRKGENTEEQIDVKTASEQIEMIWNYKVSRPGIVFENYTYVSGVARVSDREVKEWTSKEAANAYESVKEVVVKLYDSVEGKDKTVSMIDMSEPIQDKEGFVMKIVLNIGTGKIEDGLKKANGRSDVRWAFSNYGFTPSAGCNGAAENLIGQSVNNSLGYFLQNLQPFSTFGVGNPQVNSSTVSIIGTVNQVQTNYLGTAFPLFGFPPPLFVAKTTNYSTGASGGPSFPTQGEFKIHADVAFNGILPDENCFTFEKIGNYAAGNLDVGKNIHLPVVNQILGTTIFNRRSLISTYVLTNKIDPGNPQLIVKCQEHPIYHFYARVVKKLVIEPDNPIGPVEM